MNLSIFKQQSRLLILLLVLTGCGSAEIGRIGQPEFQPLIFGDVPWIDGEQSRYRILNREGNVVGDLTYELHAGEAEDGRVVWMIDRVTIAEGGNEHVSVSIDADSLRPISAELERVFPDGIESASTTYDRGDITIELRSKADVVTPEQMNISSDSRDRRTLVMLARALPLVNDYATRMNSFLPIAGLTERVELVVLDQESVEVPAGIFETWHVRMRMPASSIDAWYLVDEPHTLVKFSETRNDSTFELIEFQAE